MHETRCNEREREREMHPVWALSTARDHDRPKREQKSVKNSWNVYSRVWWERNDDRGGNEIRFSRCESFGKYEKKIETILRKSRIKENVVYRSTETVKYRRLQFRRKLCNTGGWYLSELLWASKFCIDFSGAERTCFIPDDELSKLLLRNIFLSSFETFDHEMVHK